MLEDAFGRQVTDLRISVTRRCNFSCIYCHNEGLGSPPLNQDVFNDELSPNEIERCVRIARELGIRNIKLTGGEPLLRQDLEVIIDKCVRHISDISLTTNGSMLADRAHSLRSAGLKRVNISLDSLNPGTFKNLRHGDVNPVLASIDEAIKAGLKPIKINLVVMKKTLEHIPAMIEYIKTKKGLKLQLIQFMPELVRHEEWSVDMNELKEHLEEKAESVIMREMHHRRIYHLEGAEIEVVDPVHNPEFCANCHRIRLTHNAKLKGCLNRNDDLIPLRGLDDDSIRDAFREVVAHRVPYYGFYVKGFKKEFVPASSKIRSKTGDSFLHP